MVLLKKGKSEKRKGTDATNNAKSQIGKRTRCSLEKNGEREKLPALRDDLKKRGGKIGNELNAEPSFR